MIPKKFKIVITGGPSGGKTTLIEVLQKDSPREISVVPEAASILYRGGFPRRSSDQGRRHAQRAICWIQRELEDLVLAESQKKAIVCDRGSLDSIAYWPSDESDFFSSMATDRKTELSRYDWVLHLDTAAELDFDTTNPIRTESHKEALELNTRIRAAWAGHPQRLVIPHQSDFSGKIQKAKKIVEQIIHGDSFAQVSSML